MEVGWPFTPRQGQATRMCLTLMFGHNVAVVFDSLNSIHSHLKNTGLMDEPIQTVRRLERNTIITTVKTTDEIIGFYSWVAILSQPHRFKYIYYTPG